MLNRLSESSWAQALAFAFQMRLMSLDGPRGMAMRQNALVKSCVAEEVRLGDLIA